MRGPMPKDPALRQRRNKASTRATLQAVETKRRRMPSLPKRADDQQWHPEARKWWRTVWASPMAAEYIEADALGLARLALAVDRFWKKPSLNAISVIAHDEQRFGLSPLDRRRLEWVIERAEAEKKRRPAATSQGSNDPRKALFQVVS